MRRRRTRASSSGPGTGSCRRSAPDGAKPSGASMPARPCRRRRRQPGARIAILVGGLGISQSATAGRHRQAARRRDPRLRALRPDLRDAWRRARASGHEIMLQVPMEPFDYPDNDPGPHTLTPGQAAGEHRQRLHWAHEPLHRLYGVDELHGRQVTASEAGARPGAARDRRPRPSLPRRRLVAALARRRVAPSARAPTARADVVVDSTPKAEAIDASSAGSRRWRASEGLAIGTASACRRPSTASCAGPGAGARASSSCRSAPLAAEGAMMARQAGSARFTTCPIVPVSASC